MRCKIVFFVLFVCFNFCIGQYTNAILLNHIDKNQFLFFKNKVENTPTDINKFVLDKTSNNLYTLLGYSIKQNKPIFIDFLLKHGAKINIAKSDDYYVYDGLYVSIENQNLDAVKRLLDQGSDPNKLYNENGLCPLVLSCRYPNENIVNELIKHGAKIDGLGDSGGEYTSFPLLEAITYQQPSIVDLLLKKGANIEIKNRQNEDIFVLSKQNEVITTILNEYIQKKDTTTLIEKVFFNSEDYSIEFTTNDKKTYQKELFEIFGYKVGTVKVNKEKNIEINFYSNQSAYVQTEMVFYGKKELLILD
ncbi:ankyrin repeat domain-containing protein, partial [Chryseobacterium sp. SN22]|uniref:ankyrin repeat domain-containing protein n=1 Tax=Chryseobacterium sp. SN22 TaxID=2606431 RepID=UPI0011EBE9EF